MYEGSPKQVKKVKHVTVYRPIYVKREISSVLDAYEHEDLLDSEDEKVVCVFPSAPYWFCKVVLTNKYGIKTGFTQRLKREYVERHLSVGVQSVAILRPFQWISVQEKDTHLRSDENFIKNRKGKWIGPDLQLSHIKYRPFFKANFDCFVEEPALGMTENDLKLVRAHGFWFGIHNVNSDDVGEWVEHTWVISNFGWNFFHDCKNHPNQWLHVPVGKCRVNTKGSGLKMICKLCSNKFSSRSTVRVNRALHPLLKSLDTSWPKIKFKQLYNLPSCIFHSFASALFFLGERKNIGKIRHLASIISSKANSMLSKSTSTHERLNMIH